MIPYQIGEAGDAASLLCAVCAPAVSSSMGALCAVYGRGTTSGRRGLGENSCKTMAKSRHGQEARRWKKSSFPISALTASALTPT